MSEITYDIGEMLDGLGLTTASIRWNEILNDPELGDFTAQQLFREVLAPQYVEAMNRRYETNLKFSKLINKSARIENLKTGNGRKYNDEVVQQILTFRFVSSGLNIGVYGKTGAGKSGECQLCISWSGEAIHCARQALPSAETRQRSTVHATDRENKRQPHIIRLLFFVSQSIVRVSLKSSTSSFSTIRTRAPGSVRI